MALHAKAWGEEIQENRSTSWREHWGVQWVSFSTRKIHVRYPVTEVPALLALALLWSHGSMICQLRRADQSEDSDRTVQVTKPEPMKFALSELQNPGPARADVSSWDSNLPGLGTHYF
jgi:hypothetical protein